MHVPTPLPTTILNSNMEAKEEEERLRKESDPTSMKISQIQMKNQEVEDKSKEGKCCCGCCCCSWITLFIILLLFFTTVIYLGLINTIFKDEPSLEYGSKSQRGKGTVVIWEGEMIWKNNSRGKIREILGESNSKDSELEGIRY